MCGIAITSADIAPIDLCPFCSFILDVTQTILSYQKEAHMCFKYLMYC